MRKLRLPIAALIAVILAVALAGPAFGGAHVTGSASSLATAKKALRTAKSAKRLASRALTLMGPQGPTGKDGKDGNNGTNGTNGTNGINGTNGVDGTALGYAQISGGPTVLKSKNITQANVTSPIPGYFCFYNMPFTPNVANATLTHPTTGNPAVNANTYFVSARVGGNDPTCPGSEQASVITNNSAGTLGNAEFQIVFN